MSSSLDSLDLEDAERRWAESALLALLGLAPPPPGGRDVLFAGWRTFLERLAAARGPVTLALDDLHDASPDLLDFLDHVVRWAQDSPILVLGLSRPELLDRRPAWGEERASTTLLRLAPLDPDAVGRLLAELVPGLPVALAHTVVERADGIPPLCSRDASDAGRRGSSRARRWWLAAVTPARRGRGPGHPPRAHRRAPRRCGPDEPRASRGCRRPRRPLRPGRPRRGERPGADGRGGTPRATSSRGSSSSRRRSWRAASCPTASCIRSSARSPTRPLARRPPRAPPACGPPLRARSTTPTPPARSRPTTSPPTARAGWARRRTSSPRPRRTRSGSPASGRWPSVLRTRRSLGPNRRSASRRSPPTRLPSGDRGAGGQPFRPPGIGSRLCSACPGVSRGRG